MIPNDKAKELEAKFEEWLAKERETGDWHYSEDFFDDVEEFVRGQMPEATDDEVQAVAKVLADENEDRVVERGSRYEEKP